MSTYYVDDVGTEIVVDTKTEIGNASVHNLLLRKPSGKEVTWVGGLGPVDAIGRHTTISYIVKSGDWDEPGWWSLQSYVELGGWHGKGSTAKFELKPKFK